MFETNVFGLIAIPKRAAGNARPAPGRIINISSLGGLVGFPGSGYYNATSSRWRACRTPWQGDRASGHRVTLIEPGRSAPTGRAAPCARPRRPSPTTPRAPGPPQGHQRQQRKTAGRSHAGGGGDHSGGQSPEPPRHLLLGRFAYEQVQDKLKASRKRWRLSGK